MTIRSRLYSLAAVVVFAIAIAACSSDDNPAGGGTTDTTPPTVSNVAAVDESHIDVTFSEAVSKTSAEDTGHYIISAVLFPAAPGAASAGGQSVVAASLRTDKKTVTLTTGVPMGAVNYTLSVNGVADTHGNSITTTVDKPFTGSGDPDATAPEIVSRSPAPDATNVGIGTPVVVQFSEPVTDISFNAGASWTSPGGPVSFNSQQDGTTFTLVPNSALANGTIYTVTLTGVKDLSDNTMADTHWDFTTTNVADVTPPTLVSTVPANLATNVDVNANLSLTFSEAVNQIEFDVALTPDPGNGVPTWSNGGKTVTFDPDAALLDNQQYTLTIFPDGVRDLAANGFVGVKTVIFTTGSALTDGSIAGTITGDPGSGISDPTGATVIAPTSSPVNGGDFDIVSSTIVAANNTYTLSHLPDGDYFPFAIKDTNDDGNLDPSSGDAIGAYGIDFALGDQDPDSVIIVGGNHATGVSFPMIDPSAITGTVEYSGTYADGFYPVFIGLFDTTGFDPSDVPVVGTEAFYPGFVEWGFNTLDYVELVDDDYYVGAFMDVNDNGTFEQGVDPSGFYGGFPAPTALHISNGNDIAGIVITLTDPLTANSSASVAWPSTKHNAKFQRLCDVVRQSQTVVKK